MLDAGRFNEMKKKLVWRFYCEFCKKSGCSGGHIKKHEKGCTRNPDRECSLCKEKRDYRALIAKWKTEDLAWLKKEVDGCPNCMLAVIRQGADPNDPDSYCWETFHFKEELQAWWDEHNALIAEENERELMASFRG